MQKQTRIVIENVQPQLDSGAYSIKRIPGQTVKVTASVFSDGHDVVECCVKYKHEREKEWSEARMMPTFNDEWKAEFKVSEQGFYSYFIEGWVDYALNWQHGTDRKIQDNQYVKSELLEGAENVAAISEYADENEKE
jgi:starch synthase (maltosyl-transferring)